ncbi:MAG: FAD-dependent oxidoreductase [Opitutaceae bacterium]|nr:FAD-dependent oxidoreductase [Opitutaceae bacterium]
MSKAKAVVICGGGVIGLCCAYYLARVGHRVTLIDRGAEDRDHCALGSAGYVSPSQILPLAAPGLPGLALKGMFNPRSPFYLPPRLDSELLRWSWLFWRACRRRHVARSAPVLRDLCTASHRLFEEFDDIAGGVCEFERRGRLELCKTREELARQEARLARVASALGVEARVLDAGEVAALEPGVRLDVAGGVYFPGDCHLTPARFTAALTQLLAEMGVRLQWNTTVYGWHADGGRLAAVRTTAGDIVADEFVLAAGAWSPSLAGELDLGLPLQAGKGYSLTLPQPRFRPRIPMIFTEARIAVTPLNGSLRFGGTLDLSGVNTVVRPERVRQIIESVPRYFPDFRAEDFAEARPWCGLRPVSPDGLPYIGRFRRYRNLIAASGHAMLGVTLAPITGKLVAEVVDGRQPSVALSPLSPDRYA